MQGLLGCKAAEWIFGLCRRALLASALVALAVPTARGAMIQIDTFSSPSPAQFFILGSGNNPSTTMSYNSPDIIGGEREALVNVIGQGTPTSVVGIIGHDMSYGIDAMQVGTNGLAPTVVTLTYSSLTTFLETTPTFEGDSPTTLIIPGIDLTGGGLNNKFLLHFFSSDAQPTVGLDVAVTITSPLGKVSTATVDAPNSTTAFDLFIPFDKLVGDAVLTQVDSIKFVFNGVRKTANVDYEVQLLAVVPEPSTVVLLATGVAGAVVVGGLRRRSRAAHVSRSR